MSRRATSTCTDAGLHGAAILARVSPSAACSSHRYAPAHSPPSRPPRLAGLGHAPLDLAPPDPPARPRPPTPAMRQYHDAKRQHPDAILFFRMGDFYEMFYEDAVVAARALELDAHVALEGRRRRAPSRCAACRTTPPTATSRASSDAGFTRRDLRSGRGPDAGQGRRPARGRRAWSRPGTLTRRRRYLTRARRRFLAAVLPPDNGGTRAAWRCSTSRPASSPPPSTPARPAPALARNSRVLRPREVLVRRATRCCDAAAEPTALACRGDALERVAVRRRRARSARSPSSCRRGARTGSASTAIRAPSAPPARSSQYLRDTQKVDLAHVRAIAYREPRDAPDHRRRRRCATSRSSTATEGDREARCSTCSTDASRAMGARLLRALARAAAGRRSTPSATVSTPSRTSPSGDRTRQRCARRSRRPRPRAPRRARGAGNRGAARPRRACAQSLARHASPARDARARCRRRCVAQLVRRARRPRRTLRERSTRRWSTNRRRSRATAA